MHDPVKIDPTLVPVFKDIFPIVATLFLKFLCYVFIISIPDAPNPPNNSRDPKIGT